MTIAVDTRSNALIVTAPEPLFLEVEELVKMIDQSGAMMDEDVQIVSLKKGNAEAVQRALAAVMGRTTTPSSSTANRGNANAQRGGFPGGGLPFGGAATGGNQSPMQFMQRMQQQGMGGGQPFGGGQPGGFGGFGGQGGRGGFQPGGGGRGGQGGQRGGQGGGQAAGRAAARR